MKIFLRGFDQIEQSRFSDLFRLEAEAVRARTLHIVKDRDGFGESSEIPSGYPVRFPKEASVFHSLSSARGLRSAFAGSLSVSEGGGFYPRWAVRPNENVNRDAHLRHIMETTQKFRV
jgi:hypothetical protein